MCDLRIYSGGKKECSTWRHFEYNNVNDKSSCKVTNVKTGKRCAVQLAGKNATNLKSHLSRFHKDEYQLVEAQDAERDEASKYCGFKLA